MTQLDMCHQQCKTLQCWLKNTWHFAASQQQMPPGINNMNHSPTHTFKSMCIVCIGRDHIIGRHICDVHWIIYEWGDWIQVTQGRVKWQHFANMTMNLCIPQKQWSDLYQQIFKKDLHHEYCRYTQKTGTKIIQNITTYIFTWHRIPNLHLVVSCQLPDKQRKTTYIFNQPNSWHFHSILTSGWRDVWLAISDKLTKCIFTV
jgi:hypothetical protein